MSSTLHEYLWIAVVGGIFGFVYCFGIGANDCANAFATSVSSKSLTLKQAVLIASVFEFCGVLFLGASVASTVRGKIFDAEEYEDEPEIIMLGMFTSLVAASLMMMGATYLGLPVSTTHTIIGCIIGFTVAAKGFDSVKWDETKNIFISWVAAPLLTGLVAFCIFFFIQRAILLSPNPFHRGYYTFPFILFATIAINIFFILRKGTKNFQYFQEHVYDTKWVVPTSIGAGLLIGFLWLWPVGPYVKKILEVRRAARATSGEGTGGNLVGGATAVHPTASVRSEMGCSFKSTGSIGSHNEKSGSQLAKYDPEDGTLSIGVSQRIKSVKLMIDSQVESEGEIVDDAATERAGNIDKSEKIKRTKMKSFLVRFEEATYKQNLEEQCFQESEGTAACWQSAAVYDSEVEQLFTYVQVFTASLSSFAHGANDIANSIAPLAVIIDVYQTGRVNPEAPVQKWILAYGGVALSLGLLLYGYKVMKTIGYKLTAVSPTRGSSASLASSLVVASASYMGIPVSTTQCIVGAVAGIGLVEGRRKVQWQQLAKCVIGWVVVFFIAAIISALLFAFCAYSPSM